MRKVTKCNDKGIQADYPEITDYDVRNNRGIADIAKEAMVATGGCGACWQHRSRLVRSLRQILNQLPFQTRR